MAQHFVPLNFTAGEGTLTVQTPANSGIAPYGNYMLFIVNEKGVPSVSAPLNLSASPEAPGAPTAVSATASETTATVTWAVPNQGTSAISSYTVTPYVGETAQAPTTVSGTPPAASVTITGLTQGATYTFRVTATNGVGTGPPSAPSNPITISSPTAPGEPTAVSATPGNGGATATWTAPPANGSSITSYTVTPYVGTTAQAPMTVSGTPPATTATVGLARQRDHVHVHCHRHERGGNGSALGRFQPRHAERNRCPGVRATGHIPRPRRQRVGDLRGRPDRRESPDRRGRSVEQRKSDCVEREGLGG